METKSDPNLYRAFLDTLDKVEYPAVAIRYSCVGSSHQRDEDALPGILHEGVHNISNQPEDRLRGSGYDFESKGYGFYLIESNSVRSLEYVASLPSVEEVFDGSEPIAILGRYRFYLPRHPDWRIYDLLNEWNAYSSELNLLAELKSKQGCGDLVRSDSGEGAEEFMVLTSTYLKRLKTLDSADHSRLVADPKFRELVRKLLARTRLGLSRAGKFPCLFGIEARNGLKGFAAEAERELEVLVSR